MAFARTFVLGRSRAHTATQVDRQLLQMWDLTADQIRSALWSAAIGYMAPLADVIDQLQAHAVVGGVREQRKAGVKSISAEVLPADPTSEVSQEIADFTRTRWETTNRAELLDHYEEAKLRGGGLIEILWEQQPDGRWAWAGFDPVPQQRIRFTEDNRIAFAFDRNAPYGIPADEFPPGTFIRVEPHRGLPSPALRGADRKAIEEWFGLRWVGSWLLQTIQWHDMPLIWGKYANDEDEKVLSNALTNWDTGGRLLTSKEAEIEFVEKRSTAGQHLTYEQSRIERVAICYVGAPQTVTIGKEQGSKQSVEIHAGVREEILRDDWAGAERDLERDLFRPLATLNWGYAAAPLAANLVPCIPEPLNEKEFLEACKLATDSREKGGLGLPLIKRWVYRRLGWPQPSAKDDVLSDGSMASVIQLADKRRAA